MTIIASVAVLAVVGGMIWTLVDSGDETSTPQPATATELVDTMHDGLNERDLEKFTSVFTEDAVWVWEGSPTPVAIAFGTSPSDFTWERVSEVTHLGYEEPGDEFYVFVHEFGSDEITRAAMVIDLDGDRLSRAEWVTNIYGAPAD